LARELGRSPDALRLHARRLGLHHPPARPTMDVGRGRERASLAFWRSARLKRLLGCSGVRRKLSGAVRASWRSARRLEW
jgi:hypothetical protein